MELVTWMAGLAAVAAAEGLRRREAETISLTRMALALPCWPSALDGLRALVVSDLHVRPNATALGRREARLAAMLDGLECDILLVPGDCANTRGAARVAVDALSHARPRHGAFITLGNGEHKREGETQPIIEELGRLGRVLMNESVRVPLNGVDLWVLGVDDPSQDRDRLDQAARTASAGIPEAAPKILVAHSPEIVTRLHRTPVDLVVCGHTHGGQVCPPNGQALWTQTQALDRSSLGYGAFGPDDFARYNPNPLERPRMYVSRGVGTAKLPIRAFCRPEIALLTLRSGEGAGGLA